MIPFRVSLLSLALVSAPAFAQFDQESNKNALFGEMSETLDGCTAKEQQRLTAEVSALEEKLAQQQRTAESLRDQLNRSNSELKAEKSNCGFQSVMAQQAVELGDLQSMVAKLKSENRALEAAVAEYENNKKNYKASSDSAVVEKGQAGKAQTGGSGEQILYEKFLKEKSTEQTLYEKFLKDKQLAEEKERQELTTRNTELVNELDKLATENKRLKVQLSEMAIKLEQGQAATEQPRQVSAPAGKIVGKVVSARRVGDDKNALMAGVSLVNTTDQVIQGMLMVPDVSAFDSEGNMFSTSFRGNIRGINTCADVKTEKLDENTKYCSDRLGKNFTFNSFQPGVKLNLIIAMQGLSVDTESQSTAPTVTLHLLLLKEDGKTLERFTVTAN